MGKRHTIRITVTWKLVSSEVNYPIEVKYEYVTDKDSIKKQ